MVTEGMCLELPYILYPTLSLFSIRHVENKTLNSESVILEAINWTSLQVHAKLDIFMHLPSSHVETPIGDWNPDEYAKC